MELKECIYGISTNICGIKLKKSITNIAYLKELFYQILKIFYRTLNSGSKFKTGCLI